MAEDPRPGSWRLEYNDFEKEVAFAILRHPKYLCLDIRHTFDKDGNQTDDRSVPFTRADIVRVVLLDDKQQRMLHRKFFFETICKVMTAERCEFPDAKTVVVDVESFNEQHLIDLARTWLVDNGYTQEAFLWGSTETAVKWGG